MSFHPHRAFFTGGSLEFGQGMELTCAAIAQPKRFQIMTKGGLYGVNVSCKGKKKSP